MIGQTLGHYEILEKLGEGGMGVVYLAKDTTLDRSVALKVLPTNLAESQERLERFQREAKTLAALDHPNIVSIYSVEDSEDVQFLTMQLVEGKRLSELIPNGGMSVERIFEIAIPLADALAAAHERGVIHRDLKPGNIMVTAQGHLKVLDFGLAKLQSEAGPTLNTELPTEPITEQGKILGTVPYMSPEQLEGKEIDSRSDTFSLGVILHEMATGERPFKGDSSASLISAIMKDTPREVDTVREDLPHHLGRIIRRCLEKDAQRRFQSALDVRNDLQDLRSELELASKLDHAVAPEDVPTSERFSGSKAFRAVLILIVALLVASTVFLTTRGETKKEALGSTDQLLLTDFVNRTGDPVFDGTLNQALAVKLEESPFLSIIPEARVRDSLSLMGRDPNESVTPEIGREICRRQGIKAMVTGEIAVIGDNYVVSVAANECETASVLSRELVEVTGKEDVLSALGAATTKIREDLGESLASIDLYDAPVELATTSSLEALKWLTLAEEARYAGVEAESISLFQRALEMEPDFALAHARLGTVYSNLQEWEKAVYHKSRAYELRDRVSERERLYITSHYFSTVTGEVSKVIDTLKDFKRTYPREWIPSNNLSDQYNRAGLYQKAAEEAKEAVRLYPEHPLPHSNLADSYLNLGRTEDAKQVLAEAFGRGFGASYLHTTRFEIAYLEGDQAKMQETLDALDGDPRESEVLVLQAQEAASRGRLVEARRITNRAIDSADRHGFFERSAGYMARLATWEAAFGNFEAAAERARVAMGKAANRDSMRIAAIAFALAGAAEEAETLISEMSAQFPTNTYTQSVWIPLAQAAMALHDDDPEAILVSLEKAAAYERSNLIVPFLRGRALLGLDRPSEAFAEFQKISDLATVDPTAPIHTLATMGLARAFAGMGNTDASRQEYENFFALLADADEGLPLLAWTREEYAALR